MTDLNSETLQNLLSRGPLKDIDPDLNFIIDLEKERQERKIIMIASESICPEAVREVTGSVFTNIYAEGYPSLRMTTEEKDELTEFRRQLPLYRRYADRRYYKGCEYVDFVEALAMLRLAKLFETKDYGTDKIFTNVQPLSGAAANNAVYEAFLEPGDTVMGMDLSHGGHLTHGSPVNRSGKRYNIVHYGVDKKTGRLNYNEIEKMAKVHNPKMIIAGYSAYPWDIDWPRLKKIVDSLPQKAILLADIAHIAGLIIGGKCLNPVGYADVISFTTHKTLCGPRGAVILSTNREIANKINKAVFPGEQGGPHINTIAAKAVAFKIAATQEFKNLQEKITENALHLAEAFRSQGLTLAYGGTNTHMVLLDLKAVKNNSKYELDGEMASRILDLCGIVCNKNTIAGDDKAAKPTGIRFGTTWVTQRGMGREEMRRIASVVYKVVTNIKPFRYLWAGGYVGRGKIEQSVMDRAKEEIDSLGKEFPGGQVFTRRNYPYFDLAYETDQESPLLDEHKKMKAAIGDYHGYKMPINYSHKEQELEEVVEKDAVLFDMSDKGIIEIYGERAKAFLQESTTGNIYSLKPGMCQKSFVFDHNHELIDDILIMRLESEKSGRDKFLILSNASNHLKLKRWFRGLSLGYTLFDNEEIFAKIEGPVIVNDHRNKMTVLALFGPKSMEIIKKVFSDIPDIGPGGMVEKTSYGYQLLISRSDYISSTYQIILPRGKAVEFWKKVIELGVKPGGTVIRDRIREKVDLPLYNGESGQHIVEVYRKNPKLFHLSKPYFTGQKVLLESLADRLKSDKKEFKYEEKEGPLKKTPLIEEHRKLASKSSIVPFAGWEMPVKYTGIKDEHMAVREGAGLFDVAHMGVFDFKGEDAGRFLDLVNANYIARLQKGQTFYSYLLDADGIPIDDVLVYGINPPVHYIMVVNAANADKDWVWLQAVKDRRVIIDRNNPLCEVDADVEMRNLKDPSSGKDQKVDMALQGPQSLNILKEIITDRDVIWHLENLKKFHFVNAEIEGMEAMIARTGYTGEEVGFEFYLHPDNLVKLWKLLLEKGEKFGLKPTALGARDSTRTEAGLPLYGHELAGKFSIVPVEAGYGSFVKFHKPFFIGRAGSMEKEEKRTMEVARFRMNDKRIKMIKPGNPVVSKRGQYIGEVTSCALGTDDHQVGLAYIDRKFAKEGEEIAIFVLPPKVSEKQKDKLSQGDKVILPEEGVIVKRFPAAGEVMGPAEE